MEDLPANGSSSPRSPRQNNNLAQRFGRQISRTILPALRNLVRTRPPRSPRSRRAEGEPLSPSLTSNTTTPETTPETIENEPTDLLCTNEDSLPELTSPPTSPPLSPLSPLSPLLPLSPIPSINNETGLQLLNNLDSLANFSNLRGDENPSEEDTNNPANTRQRYRLVVYFEERNQQEQAAARYVAVIVGRLDELQFLLSNGTNERGFTDVLNNLFNSYAPKGTPPAAKNIIDSLPTVTITEQEQSCMICLEQFEKGSTAVVLPCKHMFHGEECVKSWLKIHNSCPICRYELPVEDSEYETQRKERMLARGFHEEEQRQQEQQDQLQQEDKEEEEEGKEDERDERHDDAEMMDGFNDEARDVEMSFNNYLNNHHHHHHHHTINNNINDIINNDDDQFNFQFPSSSSSLFSSPSPSPSSSSEDSASNGNVDWLFDDTNPL